MGQTLFLNHEFLEVQWKFESRYNLEGRNDLINDIRTQCWPKKSKCMRKKSMIEGAFWWRSHNMHLNVKGKHGEAFSRFLCIHIGIFLVGVFKMAVINKKSKYRCRNRVKCVQSCSMIQKIVCHIKSFDASNVAVISVVLNGG